MLVWPPEARVVSGPKWAQTDHFDRMPPTRTTWVLQMDVPRKQVLYGAKKWKFFQVFLFPPFVPFLCMGGPMATALDTR